MVSYVFVNLPAEYHTHTLKKGWYEMLLDEQTFKAMAPDPPPPGDGGDLEATPVMPGIPGVGWSPSIFPKRRIPFKVIGLNADGVNTHTVSSMYYAMAHRAGFVEGPPFGLATVEISDAGVLKGIWDKTLLVAPEQSRLSFCLPIRPANYDGLTDEPLLQNLVNGQALLDLGYALLSKKRTQSQ